MKMIYKLIIFFLATIILVTFSDSFGNSMDQSEQVVRITAEKFKYTPNEITVKKDRPVTLILVSRDVAHGFNCPDLGIRTDIYPERVNRIRFIPQKTGIFEFHCDMFCGDGHEQMVGKIIVSE